MLQYYNENSFFLKGTTSDEIINFVSSLNEGLTDGPNSLSIEILKPLKNDASLQMNNICNLSFFPGVFTSEFISEVIPIY